jgi:hypothetical protein
MFMAQGALPPMTSVGNGLKLPSHLPVHYDQPHECDHQVFGIGQFRRDLGDLVRLIRKATTR